MILLYNILIHFYHFLIRVFSLFDEKAKKWVRGRKDIFLTLEHEIDSDERIAWFHCASLGEFEQGRPVIESFKKAYPRFSVLLTFFSPSGYEVRKNYEGADHIFYLPIDTTANAKRFLDIVDPEIAFFIKYEYWFNYIRQLRKRQIPIVGVSSIFRPGQRFFSWYGGWQRKMLRSFTHFFVQNENTEKLLKSIGIKQVTISGDTRFDRVFEISKKTRPFPVVKKFKGSAKVFIAGSTWPPDEDILLGLIRENRKGLKFIIAPHEVHPERIESLMKKLPEDSLRFSQLNEKNCEAPSVLVIDNIGILSHLYQYGDLAHIGGGFGVGIHNILEAATFGLPVTFGPNYKKFQEARELIDREGAFEVKRIGDFLKVSDRLLSEHELLTRTSMICSNYVEEQCGATTLIIRFVKDVLKK